MDDSCLSEWNKWIKSVDFAVSENLLLVREEEITKYINKVLVGDFNWTMPMTVGLMVK